MYFIITLLFSSLLPYAISRHHAVAAPSPLCNAPLIPNFYEASRKYQLWNQNPKAKSKCHRSWSWTLVFPAKVGLALIFSRRFRRRASSVRAKIPRLATIFPCRWRPPSCSSSFSTFSHLLDLGPEGPLAAGLRLAPVSQSQHSKTRISPFWRFKL